MIQLRDYQQELYDAIHDEWSIGHNNVLAVSATGSGKTVLMGAVTHDNNGVTFVMAHRSELISQISTTLAQFDIKHNIIASKNTIRDTVKNHVREVGVSFFSPTSRIIVASVDTLPNHAGRIQSLLTQCSLALIDECFVAGTIVDGKPIEQYGIGDSVTSFNEYTGEFEDATVTHVFKNKAPDKLVRVVTQSHHVLECTSGHPFYTKRGWVEAVNLNTDDEVYVNNGEGQVFNWQRLASIEVYESSGCSFDGFTYNLEVTPNNTYVANGVVVHNCHHVLKENKWGKVMSLFPNARGLGVTATPIRSDGKGLGSHSHGIYDTMVEGKSMRWLIDNGYLSDYRIFCPPSDLDLNPVRVSKATGDFNPNDLKEAISKSHIVGDVVEQYLKIAPGKQGITFATDVQTATILAKKFNDNGVKAAVVHGKTSDSERSSLLLQFRNREIQQLVNVDLFGEGFDVPAIEVVSMARPTQSFSLYSQQFGRALRILEGKTHAIIIDHVGNVVRHGLPDANIEWTLDARDKRSKSKSINDAIPVTVCTECAAPYEKIHKVCPFCGHADQPSERSSPEFVDGDLTELDPAELAKLRGEIARIDQPSEQVVNRLKYAGQSPQVAMAAGRRHHERKESIAELKESMAWFSGILRDHHSYTNDMIYKKFYFTFGTDMATAMTLSKKDAEELKQRVDKYVARSV